MATTRQLSAQQASLLGRGATRAEALEAGVSAGTLRGPQVTTLFRGAYALSDQAATRYRAALAVAGPPVMLCDVSGLAWHGVDLPYRLSQERLVHLWRPLELVGPRIPGIRVHRTKLQCQVVTHQGLDCLHPVECWLQVAARASRRELVVLADGLVRRQAPVSSLAEMAEILQASHRRPGLATARSALELAREKTDSVMETLTRLALVEAGLPCPVVNYPVLDAGGLVTFWLDLAYPDHLIAVEYDGRLHVGDRQQMEWDAYRRRWLGDRGWRLISATAADARNDFRDIVDSVRALLPARPA